jgi:hypothetical protein
MRCVLQWGRVADPDPDWIRTQSGQWIRIRSPDPDPGGQKWPTKVKNFLKFMLWSVRWSLLRAEGFFCNLNVLYGGLGIGKLQILIKKIFFTTVIFVNFWSLKPWIRIRIRIGIQPKMLDPDKMNADPQPCNGVPGMCRRGTSDPSCRQGLWRRWGRTDPSCPPGTAMPLNI